MCLLHLVKRFFNLSRIFLVTVWALTLEISLLEYSNSGIYRHKKKFFRNLVLETQQIGFYDGQFFLLATTNIFRERQHAYLVPYASLSSIRESISASFNDHYPLNRQLLDKGLDNCEIEVYSRRWQKFLSSLCRPHQLRWPPNLSNGYQGLLYWG